MFNLLTNVTLLTIKLKRSKVVLNDNQLFKAKSFDLKSSLFYIKYKRSLKDYDCITNNNDKIKHENNIIYLINQLNEKQR